MKQKTASLNASSEFGDYRWLCAEVGVSPHTARRWVMERRIPFIKLAHGSLVRFKKADVRAWLEGSSVEATR